MRPLAAALVLATMWPSAWACSDDGSRGDLDAGDAAPVSLTIDGLTLTENLRNALSFHASWTTSEPATTVLTFDCGPGEVATLSSDTLTTAHRVFVMGLLQETTCAVLATSRAADGREAAATAEITTASLSEADFPTATVTALEPGLLQSGWTLFNLTNTFDRKIMRAVMVDEQGRYRWYYRSSFAQAGSDNDVRTVPGGVLVGGAGAIRAQRITWDGEVLWQGTERMHHDIRLWPDDEHVTYLARAAPGCDEENPAGSVVRQSIVTNEQVWEWRFCEHYDPVTDIGDWEHANTIEPFPGESAFLLSARNQNAVYRVNLDSDEVEWALGLSARPEDGFHGDFAMAEPDYFYRQHAPALLPNGHILLFDNGLVGWREESRAIEIAMDFEAMTAEVVWEYRHAPPLFTDVWGDADPLPNGNRLITFGFRDREQGSILVETEPGSDSAPLWVLELPPNWGIYRSERVVDVPRGHVVEAPNSGEE